MERESSIYFTIFLCFRISNKSFSPICGYTILCQTESNKKHNVKKQKTQYINLLEWDVPL